MNKPDEIRQAINDQFEILARIQDEIKEADSYTESEDLRQQLNDEKIELARLQRELRQAEKNILELSQNQPPIEKKRTFSRWKQKY